MTSIQPEFFTKIFRAQYITLHFVVLSFFRLIYLQWLRIWLKSRLLSNCQFKWGILQPCLIKVEMVFFRKGFFWLIESLVIDSRGGEKGVEGRVVEWKYPIESYAG